jgi:hypothetical protein
MNKFHFLIRCQRYLYPNHPVNVTPEHTTAINSHCWTGSEGGQTYSMSLEEFDVQFDDHGAHVY